MDDNILGHTYKKLRTKLRQLRLWVARKIVNGIGFAAWLPKQVYQVLATVRQYLRKVNDNPRLIFLSSELQMVVSTVVCAVYLMLWHKYTGHLSRFIPRTDLHIYIFGLAAILALIGPTTFGLFIQELYAASSEKFTRFLSFRSSTNQLSQVLKKLYEEGLVDDEYQGELYSMQMLQYEDVKGVDALVDGIDAACRLVNWVASQDKAIEKSTKKRFVAPFQIVVPLLSDIEILQKGHVM